MTNKVLIDLRNALEPRNPYYALNLDPVRDDVEVVVYNPDTHAPEFECMVTRTYAQTMLEGCAHFTVGGDPVEYEEFVNALNAPPMRASVPTCTIGDAVQFIIDAQRTGDVRNDVEVTIAGAKWLVVR